MTGALTAIQLFGRSNPAIFEQATRINTRRLLYAALLCILISLIEIAYFALAVPAYNDTQKLWRAYIILSHTLLASSMVIIALASWRLQSIHHDLKWHQLLQVFAIVLILVAGVLITSVDQLVTSAITPFLIACVLVAALFILNPVSALIGYLLALLALWFLLGVFQHDPSALISNRVNALSTVGVAFCLTIFAWSSFNQHMRQQSFIELQQADLGRKNAALAALAATDPLTGLLNRRSFKAMCQHELARMRRNGQSGSLIIIDLDHFKLINDQYGHPVGDQVLQDVTSALRQGARESDLLVRWGGEEFLLLLPGCELDQAIKTADGLRQRIADLVFTAGTVEFGVTASFGVSILQPNKSEAFNDSYRSADQALYAAKQSGRNRTETTQPKQTRKKSPDPSV